MAENDNFREIQEDIFDYFKDVDDETFISVVDIIVYHNSSKDGKATKLATKFLDEQGLGEAYVNYIQELNRPSSMWLRNVSDVEMIEKIKRAFLGLAYNRLRNNFLKSKEPLTMLDDGEKKDLRTVISGCQRHNDELMEDEEYTRKMFDKEEAEELIDERKRFAKLFTKVLSLI